MIEDGTFSAIEVATGNVLATFSVGRWPNGVTYSITEWIVVRNEA